jgi:hypothetical protein
VAETLLKTRVGYRHSVSSWGTVLAAWPFASFEVTRTAVRFKPALGPERVYGRDEIDAVEDRSFGAIRLSAKSMRPSCYVQIWAPHPAKRRQLREMLRP